MNIMIIDRIKNWVIDYRLRRRYGIDRGGLMRCNVIFSEYMLPRLEYMRMNLNELTRIPLRLNEVGEEVGTMDVSEWGMILDDIIYALRYDCGIGRDMIGSIPSHGEQQYISEYMNKFRSDVDRYKRGCRLLGLYYGDLWG